MAAAVLLAAPAQARSDAPPGELIVRFAAGSEASDRVMARERAGVELESTLGVPRLQLVEVERNQTAGAAERALERTDGVLYAEPNYYRRTSLRPSDPLFGEQWGFENTGQAVGLAGADTDAPAAWDITTGSPETVVAVIDTGVFLDHPDLTGSSWTNPGESGAGRETNLVDDDGNGLVDDVRGWDWVDADADPADENGHGTHVAGTVGARGDNGQGVAGTSWSTSLMALRVLGANGTGTVADVLSAYRYAAANGARIINASLVSTSLSQAEQDAIAAAPNVMFVVAAGNGGQDGVGDDNDRAPEYPCAYPLANIVCVAATNRGDELSTFSNYGAGSVDLAAPGEWIVSTWLDGGYAYTSGTSMATPHVAGTAALLAAAQPDLNVAEMRAALLDGTDPLTSLNGLVASGGRLDSRRSLEVAAPGTIPDPAPPAPPEAPPVLTR
ncbi:MAG TPA: S8 family peptidase [Thermoleophilaceae bacterium]|nr:S8 family peptidase [Thermoleophilaceae bacterium]